MHPAKGILIAFRGDCLAAGNEEAQEKAKAAKDGAAAK